jgi:hypothetical protein
VEIECLLPALFWIQKVFVSSWINVFVSLLDLDLGSERFSYLLDQKGFRVFLDPKGFRITFPPRTPDTSQTHTQKSTTHQPWRWRRQEYQGSFDLSTSKEVGGHRHLDRWPLSCIKKILKRRGREEEMEVDSFVSLCGTTTHRHHQHYRRPLHHIHYRQ